MIGIRTTAMILFKNVFWTDGARATSPLLIPSILGLLSRIRAQSGPEAEGRYITLSDVVNALEPCGIREDDVTSVVEQLLTHSLVESFDPHLEELSDGTRIAITDCGKAHLDLALYELVYAEQMALSTGYSNELVRDQISELARDMWNLDNRGRVLELFKGYLLQEDRAKMTVGASEILAPLRKVRSDLAVL
jgi:hypothetical protein